MANHIVLIENARDWLADFPEVAVVTAADYLMNPAQYKNRNTRVINLCRNYRYLSTGYYCSLLGEARRHKVIPSVRTLTDLGNKSIYSLNIEDIHGYVNKALKRYAPLQTDDRFELSIFFGQSDVPELLELGRQIFEAVRCPLLKVEFRRQQHWQIQSLRAVSLNSLKPEQYGFFSQSLLSHLSQRWRSPRTRQQARYDLAVLHNPDEKLPPSDNAALKKFVDAGKRMGINVELIRKKDYSRLAEYDGLFIRETTAIDHYTYRFAKRAEAEGMVVIDDPDSIVKCTNKVYLAELLSANRIAAPRTRILRKGEPVPDDLDTGYPVVLKIPDGSFSRGIYKAESFAEAQDYMTQLFRSSDLILAQEFLFTEFDWRIGILNKQPLFACQYFMSPAHWQIVKHGPSGNATEGGYQAWDVEQAPANVVDLATRAANLIGNGFYGVDVKQTPKGAVVIEVNDNPNIEAGVEDAVLGNQLYQRILQEFLERMEQRRNG